ncbi:MAG: toprim domain-containing protein, partial [Verrucomicrobiales bacterium]
ILPIRGKLINVEKARLDRVLQNKEIQTMITAIGTGIGDGEEEGSFNLEKARYHKIVIMTDADIDGAHIRTLLLTFFCRQMLGLVKAGYVYIAQPPLYKISRKKKEQYVADDGELNKILIGLGADDVKLRAGTNGDENCEEFADDSLKEILEMLAQLNRYSEVIARNSGDFESYLNHGKEGRLPEYLVQIREGNEVYVEYALDEAALRDFAAENSDLHLFERKEDEAGEKHEADGSDETAQAGEVGEEGEKAPGIRKTAAATDGTARRSRLIEIHEANSIAKLLQRLAEIGLNIEHFSSQEEPIFEIVEGEGENAKSHPIFSVPEILGKVMEIGKRGMEIQRFKGLGEMNAKELFSTTMDPENRKLLRVNMDLDADFDLDSGDGGMHKPRRRYIEDNALNVRNLDV